MKQRGQKDGKTRREKPRNEGHLLPTSYYASY
jgi:hypothetical protein